MLEPAAAGSAGPRAFLRIGGTTVARQQLALAQALGCERVVCIAPGLSPELIALQHSVERGGGQFHVIAGPRALAGLVTANDDLIVLSDGLFASIEAVVGLLEQGQAVLVQPIEQGLAAGFERIDLDHAAAGAMRLPGRLVERMAELPADCDAASSLQRIALQAGIRQRPIPPLGDAGQFWTLLRNEQEAHAIEPRWVRQRLQDNAPYGPGRWLAQLTARRIGPAMLHAGSGPTTLGIAAVSAALMAVGAGWLGLASVGLGLCALGSLLCVLAERLARIEADRPPSPALITSRTVYGWVSDAIIVVLAGLGAHPFDGQPWFERFFAPLMLLALLRIVPRRLAPGVAAWLQDRILLALGLAIVIALGVGSTAIQLAAIAVALAGMLLPGPESRLTRP